MFLLCWSEYRDSTRKNIGDHKGIIVKLLVTTFPYTDHTLPKKLTNFQILYVFINSSCCSDFPYIDFYFYCCTLTKTIWNNFLLFDHMCLCVLLYSSQHTNFDPQRRKGGCEKLAF